MLTSDFSKEEELAASCIMEPKENTLIMVNDKSINCETDWIINFGCFNHMTEDEKKLSSKIEYRGKRVVVITNNSSLLIMHIGEIEIVPCYSPHLVQLHNVYEVLGMKKNLLSMS